MKTIQCGIRSIDPRRHPRWIGFPIPVIDGLLSATARVHYFPLVTRNAADVAVLGAKILDPFRAQ